MSCSGGGYLSGNMMVPFPFEDGQGLSWVDEAGEHARSAFTKCFVDASVSIMSESIPEDGWPSIGEISVDGGVFSFTVSACGSGCRLSSKDDGLDFPYVTGSAEFGSCVVTISSEGVREFISLCESGAISPPAVGYSSTDRRDGGFLRISPKCISVSPGGLRSIMVYDGIGDRSEGPHITIAGDVSIRSGHNISIPESDAGITIDAEPGAGLGKVQCIPSESCTMRRPKLVSPDGHVRFFNDTCYDLEPGPSGYAVIDGEDVPSRQLIVHAKCTACCTCSMYESIVKDRLKPIFDSVMDAKSRIDGYLSDYESAVSKFNARISKPEISDISLSLSGMPIGENVSPRLNGSSVKGKMSRCAFTAMLRNSSYCVVTATMYGLSGTDSVVEASATWSDEDGSSRTKTVNSSGSMIGSKFTVFPGRSLAVTFISAKDAMDGRVSTGGYEGSISFGLSYRTASGLTGSLGIVRKTVNA